MAFCLWLVDYSFDRTIKTLVLSTFECFLLPIASEFLLYLCLVLMQRLNSLKSLFVVFFFKNKQIMILSQLEIVRYFV